MRECISIGRFHNILPIMQGGMGVGISRSRLAGAVALAGGIGIISTAQIGYDEPGFDADINGSNLYAIKKHIKKAKEISKGNGLVGVNVMHALLNYREHVMTAAKAGADVIVCGAGLATDLPELVKGTGAYIAPIVSTEKAANIIIKMWTRHYDRLPDMVVIEGPLAGGHLGFKREELDHIEHLDYDAEVRSILEYIHSVENTSGHSIPVFLAGGISDRKAADHAFSLGANGIQVATRFVATVECDAADAYKQAYINARPEDVRIIKSPVGMPGRALDNAFIRSVSASPHPPTRCYRCIRSCNPAKVPYCITDALVRAVKGDIDNGLIFCGANVGSIDHISTVKEVVNELLSI